MVSDRLRHATVAAIAVSLAGCASTGGSGLGHNQPDNFGEATRQTFAAQIINPNPEYADQVPATTGAQVAAAIERYRTGRVKQPVSQRTSQVGNQSGGAGSASPGSGK